MFRRSVHPYHLRICTRIKAIVKVVMGINKKNMVLKGMEMIVEKKKKKTSGVIVIYWGSPKTGSRYLLPFKLQNGQKLKKADYITGYSLSSGSKISLVRKLLELSCI